MPIKRARKEELVAEYVEMLSDSNGVALVQTRGLSVPRVQALRGKIREAGGKYVVAKNTLLTKALEQAGWAIPEELLQGPNAIIFGMENFPGVAKAVLDFAKDEAIDVEKLNVTGGILGGQEILDSADVKDVSELPTLPELQAQIIGLIIQPAQNLVNILHNAESGVVNVLQAWLDKEQQDEGEAA